MEVENVIFISNYALDEIYKWQKSVKFRFKPNASVPFAFFFVLFFAMAQGCVCCWRFAATQLEMYVLTNFSINLVILFIRCI